jgi:hypothetical protein
VAPKFEWPLKRTITTLVARISTYICLHNYCFKSGIADEGFILLYQGNKLYFLEIMFFSLDNVFIIINVFFSVDQKVCNTSF